MSTVPNPEVQITRDWLTRADHENADRTAVEYLLAETLNVPRLELPLHLTAPIDIADDYHRLTVDHEPLQYILGFTEFHGLRIRCSPAALIPRPETEQLVLLALPHLAETPAARLIDVGTGTGCIPIALGHLTQPRPRHILAIDTSAEALALAAQNAADHDIPITFHRGDLLDGQPPASADLITANLPYIPTSHLDGLDPNVRDHEPRLALDGGADGLDLIRRLAVQARSVLAPGGLLLLEIDDSHPDLILPLLIDAGFDAPALHPDLTQRLRFASAVAPPPKERSLRIPKGS